MAPVEMVIDSVRRSTQSDKWTIVLKEKGKECYLPIYVGTSPASLLGRELQGIGYSGLEDYVHCLSGIDPTAIEVESVVIDRFEDNCFRAKLVLAQPDIDREVDCPLGAALALAVRRRSPIFADEAVLNKAAIAV